MREKTEVKVSYEINTILHDLFNQIQYELAEQYEEQIDQLTNNWNELEEFIQKELDNNVDGIKSFGGYQCKIILDKMKEIKGGDDNNV